jgi:hypothetical protein
MDFVGEGWTVGEALKLRDVAGDGVVEGEVLGDTEWGLPAGADKFKSLWRGVLGFLKVLNRYR